MTARLGNCQGRRGWLRLDVEEPVVEVGLFAGLDVGEAGVEAFAKGVFGAGGDFQELLAIADAGDGRDDGGGADAEGFLESAGGVIGEDFVDGDGALFVRDAHFAQEGEHGIASDAGKNCAGEGRSDGDAFDDEHDVHDAGLFDEAAILAIEPHDVVKALALGELGGEEASAIVAGGFGVAGAAGKGAHIFFFSEETNGLGEVGSTGRGEDDQAIGARGVDHERGVVAKVDGADVQGAAFAEGNPVAIGAEEFEEAVAEKIGGNFGHGETSGGTIHARVIVHGTEGGDAAVGGAMGFETFKEGLAVVEGGERGGEGHVGEGNDAGVVPGAVAIVGDEHVIGVIGAEGGVFAEVFGEAGVSGAGDGDGCWHWPSCCAPRVAAWNLGIL